MRLTLGELEALAGTWATWLLTLTPAGIAGQEPVCLEEGTISLVEFVEGARDCEAECSSLALEATSGGLGLDIIGLDGIHDLKRLEDGVLHRDRGEVILEALAVDADLSGTRSDLDASDCRLAASCGGGFSGGHD